jgi:hypothetical protein
MAKKSVNPPGRPRKIKSPEEMDRLVDNYIAMCRAADEPILLTGMILSLGLSSRDAFDEYLNYEGFSNPVKRAKMFVEMEYEKRLNTASAAAGPIFALKNFGWKDKQEVQHSGDQNAPLVIVVPNED